MKLNTWGGVREGAGRKPKGEKAGVPHRTRGPLASRYPLHLTWRMRDHVWNLRSRRSYKVIEAALFKALHLQGFRVVHYSVQGNHLHLIVEARDVEMLYTGFRRLGVRIAMGLNRLMKRHGPVFSDRYHARWLGTPSEVRNAIAYVLQNFRRHAQEWGERLPPGWIDPCSSAAVLIGWRGAVTLPDTGPPPVSEPRTWLLETGWRRRGLLSLRHVPGRLS